jgi:hypothetical protein
MVDLQMKRITAEPIHGLNVKTFYKLFVIITLVAPSAKAQMLEGQLHNQQLTSLDIEQGLSGLAIIYNGIIESAVDGKSTKVKKSNNYYLWDGALSIVFFSEKSPLPYGIYLNRRQQNLLLGMPANANVDIKFGNVDGANQ